MELSISSKQGLEFLVHQGILVSGWHPPARAKLDCEPTRASLQVATSVPVWCSIFPAWNGKRRNKHEGSTQGSNQAAYYAPPVPRGSACAASSFAVATP